MNARLHALLGTTILTGLVATSGAAFATVQDPSPPNSTATQIEDVVVTGSRIRRDPLNAPTPLIQVDNATLLSTGHASIIDLLATIPALSNSMVPADTTGTGLNDGGLSLPNLRSLGAGRTLTLVDGRRHIGSSGGSLSVDADAIPRLLIQNIEIITGGASSIYGADAVSGVINFVMRKDFDGVEIDAHYGMINQGGQAGKRVSVLVGRNLLDDRLNVYAHGEYEQTDEVTTLDIDWIRRAPIRIGLDADPTTARFDGILDTHVLTGALRLDNPRWGQTTLANVQPPSDLTNPHVPYEDCFAGGPFTSSVNCFGPAPGKTFWFEGSVARPANFGQRVGVTGIHRSLNIGGDGENPAEFDTSSLLPRSESQRYQVGATFRVNESVDLYAEAKYITEDTFDRGQPTYFDVDLRNSYGADQTNPVPSSYEFDLRWEDNAFLPENLKGAVRDNMVTPYDRPTAGAPGQPLTPIAVPAGRHALFGPDRWQDNTRELFRYVLGATGYHEQVGFFRNVTWDLGFTYGQVEVENLEAGLDAQRFALAADAVVDTAGLVNGRTGEIVCRAQLLAAQGVLVADRYRGGDLRDTPYGQDSIRDCTPLNIFGKGNQSAKALEYVDALVHVQERNEQEQAVAWASGELWDFWGAGPLAIAAGVEYRRESTKGTGRDRDRAGRLLTQNASPDFLEASYETKEVFGELALPLLRDHFLGDYAELSGSYRYADYSTIGQVEVYGVNLVYRPIPDITVKTSFNTSIRAPNLDDNFSPHSQTYWNGVSDPCATQSIIAVNEQEKKDNRIKNCTTLASERGLTFDFAGATASNADDFRPVYTSGLAGVMGGNPNLKPEESSSFTFSTVLQPRFFPNLSLVLDYYEIQLEQVISAVSAAKAAENCVEGRELDLDACRTVFRNNPSIPFGLGAPAGDPVGAFIQGSLNYAKSQTRGLDFTARYRLDLDQSFGRAWGVLDYSLRGNWLIEQKQFVNISNPSDFTEYGGRIGSPRVRLSSSLTWTPNDTWSVNWTMDWQTAQNIIRPRDFILNADSRPTDQLDTGNFARHDFTVRWNVRENLSVRGGVVNAFDTEQPLYMGMGLNSNLDPYGRRFFIGLNYRPW